MSILTMPNWNGQAIQVATSRGGVFAVCDPWAGLIRGGVEPWPPPELVQKLYQSHQASAFDPSEQAVIKASLGYYTDLQSLHSEDALTWSLFGPLVYAAPDVRAVYASNLINLCTEEAVPVSESHIWLWRRLPHPDTLVSGGPEIDFAIQTSTTLVLGEAKWRSHIGQGQGKDGSKDQLQLRVEFCQKYGKYIYPGVQRFIILLVSDDPTPLTAQQRALGNGDTDVVATTWKHLGDLLQAPLKDEFDRYLEWKRAHSKPK